MTEITFRFAQRQDVPLILEMIRALAEYEQLLSEVVATESVLEEWLFDKEKAEKRLHIVEGLHRILIFVESAAADTYLSGGLPYGACLSGLHPLLGFGHFDEDLRQRLSRYNIIFCFRSHVYSSHGHMSLCGAILPHHLLGYNHYSRAIFNKFFPPAF